MPLYVVLLWAGVIVLGFGGLLVLHGIVKIGEWVARAAGSRGTKS